MKSLLYFKVILNIIEVASYFGDILMESIPETCLDFMKSKVFN